MLASERLRSAIQHCFMAASANGWWTVPSAPTRGAEVQPFNTNQCLRVCQWGFSPTKKANLRHSPGCNTVKDLSKPGRQGLAGPLPATLRRLGPCGRFDAANQKKCP
mmetsp:Transcript_97860/g.204047  ORF Transcript_97860/g.204047 Transcript_97860/m.204047 type:complete len:107 (-) Transcript_97860:32-352(-)